MDLKQEKKLIAAANKDPEKFGEIFEEYYSKILHYTLKRTGDIKLAEDITSDVFFIVLQKLWQFRWQNAPFSAWLIRIAQNEINAHFRKQKMYSVSLDQMLQDYGIEPQAGCDIEAELKEAEQILEKHEDFLLIQRKLRELPIKYQEVLALKFFEKKKIREICFILKKGDNTIKSLIKRGLELLKKMCMREKITQQFSRTNISKVRS